MTKEEWQWKKRSKRERSERGTQFFQERLDVNDEPKQAMRLQAGKKLPSLHRLMLSCAIVSSALCLVPCSRTGVAPPRFARAGSLSRAPRARPPSPPSVRVCCLGVLSRPVPQRRCAVSMCVSQVSISLALPLALVSCDLKCMAFRGILAGLRAPP